MDCACSRPENRCIEFRRPFFSAIALHLMPLFNQTIRRKIVGIALGLIVLMLVTSILSMVMSSQVGVLLDELTDRYIPAYGHLARANIRSLERSVALRRMVMMKMQAPAEE